MYLFKIRIYVFKNRVNTHRNMIHTESQLLGIHIPLGRDKQITHNYKYFEKIQGINRPKQIEKQSQRAGIASAWLYRTTSQFHHKFYFLIHKKIQKCHLTYI